MTGPPSGKILILGDDRHPVIEGEIPYLRVTGAEQAERGDMIGPMTQIRQETRQRGRKLRVDEKFHRSAAVKIV